MVVETHVYVVGRAGASYIKLSDSDFLRSCTGESIKSRERLLANFRSRSKRVLIQKLRHRHQRLGGFESLERVSSYIRRTVMAGILPIPSIGIPAAIHFLTWLTIPCTLE